MCFCCARLVPRTPARGSPSPRVCRVQGPLSVPRAPFLVPRSLTHIPPVWMSARRRRLARPRGRLATGLAPARGARATEYRAPPDPREGASGGASEDARSARAAQGARRETVGSRRARFGSGSRRAGRRALRARRAGAGRGRGRRSGPGRGGARRTGAGEGGGERGESGAGAGRRLGLAAATGHERPRGVDATALTGQDPGPLSPILGRGSAG